MPSPSNGKIMAPVNGFDYGTLKFPQAEKLRTTAKGIRDKINKSLLGLIEAGQGLLSVKAILAHGQFGPWLATEFGWTDRQARRLMDVAEQFGPKTDLMSDLAITPSALYLLAAPSTPFEARQSAIERAQSGEKITPAIANEIIGKTRKNASHKYKNAGSEGFSQRLKKALERFRDVCEPKMLADFARQLRQFASDLEKKGSR